MATFLDIGVFSYFSVVFIFLLVFTVVFALMNYIKIFGAESKQGWNAIIALCIAAIALMSRSAINFLSFVTPWFVLLFFVIFFIMFAIRMFGLEEKDMKEIIKDSTVYWFILVFVILIVLFGLGNTLGQSALPYTTPGATPTATTDTGTAATDSGTASTGTDTGTTSTAVGSPGSTATPSFQQNLYATIFNPKVLGMFFLLVIATVSVAILAQRA